MMGWSGDWGKNPFFEKKGFFPQTPISPKNFKVFWGKGGPGENPLLSTKGGFPPVLFTRG